MWQAAQLMAASCGNGLTNNVSPRRADAPFFPVSLPSNWGLGTVDPSPTLVSQGGSFDQIAGSILGMFDFDGRAPNTRRLILDDQTGLVVGGHGGWSD